MKSIAVVDTLWDGHHPTYLQCFARVLLESGHEVVAVCPHPEEVARWVATRCPALESRFRAIALDEPRPSRFPIRRLQPAATAFARWKRLGGAVRAITAESGRPPDITFIAWLDTYLPSMHPAIVDRLFPHAWSGLYFHQRHLRQPGQRRLLRRGPLAPTAALSSSRCPAVAVLDEGIADTLQRQIAKPVIVFPDFIDASLSDAPVPLVARIREKAAGRPIVGLLGAIDKRKGLYTLLEASRRSAGDWLFLFAGRLVEGDFTAEERAELMRLAASAPDNCFFHLDRLPDEAQFNALVQACDVVFAAYENFPGSSNLVTKAAFFRKPLIVSRGHCMGERVERHRLGHVMDAGDVAECIAILGRLRAEIFAGRPAVPPDYEGYMRLHSADRLRPAFEEILRRV